MRIRIKKEEMICNERRRIESIREKIEKEQKLILKKEKDQ